jgi:hypothetical protein
LSKNEERILTIIGCVILVLFYAAMGWIGAHLKGTN